MARGDGEYRAVALALLAGTATPAIGYLIVLTCMGAPGFGLLLFCSIFFLTLAHGIILGVPAFILLKRFNAVKGWTSLLTGFLIGWLPYTLFVAERDGPRQAWSEFFLATCGFGIIGAICAGVSWLVYRLSYGKKAGLNKSSATSHLDLGNIPGYNDPV